MFKNVIRTLSLSLLLVLTTTMVYAQNSKSVTKAFSNAPLNTVLKEIEAQTGYKFIYEIAAVTSAISVSIELQIHLSSTLSESGTTTSASWKPSTFAYVTKKE